MTSLFPFASDALRIPHTTMRCIFCVAVSLAMSYGVSMLKMRLSHPCMALWSLKSLSQSLKPLSSMVPTT